jgi:catechol 2,3-dioxygenase-like lactoylglutathione lyase family enzyme
MIMKISRIKETCLYINDIDEAYDFYTGQLGLECFSKVEGRHIFFRVGPDVLLCFLPEVTRKEETLPPHWAEGPQHIAFEVSKEDYQSVKREAEESGIVITHTQDWGGGKYESFYFEDPSKNVLEIIPAGMWD